MFVLLQAFKKGSKLTVDVSTAIVGLEENGELQRIHDKWFGSSQCDFTDSTESNHLGLASFWGIFLVTGLVSLTAVVFYFKLRILSFMKILTREIFLICKRLKCPTSINDIPLSNS